jgi:hypothetical protein
MAFELIQKKIKYCESQLINGQDHYGSLLLSELKQKHKIACQSVDSINHTFGWMLLLSTTHFVVAIISISYTMFQSPGDRNFGSTLFLAYTFFHLPFICFAADHISIRVFRLLIEFQADKFYDEVNCVIFLIG